jgi:ribosomal protein S18 acetylase RimI-like enzyme
MQQRVTTTQGDSSIRIRAFTLADYDQVTALWQAVGFHLRAGDSRDALRYKITGDGGPFLVAESAGQVIGTAMGSWDGRWAWINRVAVAPACRRQGIARRLVAEVEKSLTALGARRIGLLTGRENPIARQFYESLGYRLREDVFVMSKDMSATEEAAA